MSVGAITSQASSTPILKQKNLNMTHKVYYNSACPVCKAGIKDQRRRMEQSHIQNLEWIDVHQHPEAIHEIGSALEQVRERLHVRDGAGNMHIGIDAFIYLWQQTPQLRLFARLLQLPIIHQSAHLAYNVFAKGLYLWNRALKHW